MNRLKELRLQRKLTIRALAEKIGISHTQITHIENGRRNLTVETAQQFASFFGVSVDYLLGAEASEMFDSFVDSMRRIFYITSVSGSGDACQGLPQSMEPRLRTKLEILFLLQRQQNPESLEAIYSLCRSLSAKGDFID